MLDYIFSFLYYQFVNPAGTAQQIADRDKVKDLLQQLLPKFKRMVNKDLEEKQRLLTENPRLVQLYMDLVQSKIITTEEFWTDHATPYIKKQAESKGTQQDVGVSASFLVTSINMEKNEKKLHLGQWFIGGYQTRDGWLQWRRPVQRDARADGQHLPDVPVRQGQAREMRPGQDDGGGVLEEVLFLPLLPSR